MAISSPIRDKLKLQPPRDEEFFEREYMPSDALEELRDELIQKRLQWLEGYQVRVLWKRKGGKSSGHNTLGKCTAPRGLQRFLTDDDWVIWLAADHARDLKLTAYQVEALLYHELLHCTTTGDDEKPSTIGQRLSITVCGNGI